MKKKILFILLASFLLTGVVSAASLWGNYKGNAIIKVNVDGKQYTTKGVPPVSLNGQVMLPLNILKQLGITYTYDSKKMTASIAKPEPEVVYIDNGSSGTNDVEKIKSLFTAADYYNRTETLGSMITELSSNLSLAYDSISYGDGSYLDSAESYFSQTIDSYNNHIVYFDSIKGNLKANGIDISTKANEIMKYYFDAIDYYKEAFTYLSAYRRSLSNSDFNSYLSNSGTGFDTAGKGRTVSLQEYFSYSERINKY